MRLLTYLLAAGLGAVFVASGTAKLRDLPTTARSFRALGLPAPYRLARAVAAVELLDAALLVLWPGVGALVALVALLLFSAALADGLRRGVQTTCGCFGARSSGPLSWRDLQRNALLAAAAIAVVLVWGFDLVWT